VSRATLTAGAGELAAGAVPVPGPAAAAGRGPAGRGPAGRGPAGRGPAGGLRCPAGVKAGAGGGAGGWPAGDPMSAVCWNIRSLRDIERKLAARGFAVKKDAIARIMRADGCSLQGMSRVKQGCQYPDRDAQSGRINDMIALFVLAGEPVISVDAKKKELVGEYHRPGRTWQPAGRPVRTAP